MMSAFKYTPYDGTTQPFTMGLRPLALKDWLEPDGHPRSHLAEKRRLYAETPETVFAAIPGTEAAQAELCDIVIEHLKLHHPAYYEFTPDSISLKGTNFSWPLKSDLSPLALAGQIVQEDFCLIDPHKEEPRLAAASLCFPSSWSLQDKIGKSLGTVHDPVPGYAGEMSRKVDLMMRNMPADRLVWRMNWSLDEGPALHRPKPHCHKGWLQKGEDPLEQIYIRIERQTLRRLPKTGFIVFTIRIYTDQLRELCRSAQNRPLKEGLREQLSALTPEQLAYKGLTEAAPVILKALKD